MKYKKIIGCIFWKLFSRENIAYISNIATTTGFISIIFLFINYNKESAQEQERLAQERANNKIIEAAAIFDDAKNSVGRQIAFKLFLEAKKDKPNDITGYRKFYNLADSIHKGIRNKNGRFLYDENVEKYFRYADSLSVYSPNKAEDELANIQILKVQGRINNKNHED
ncbi:MAG: hypothetical protein LBV71_12170 [Prevotella sp.]|nr:hypothetical protein [Prevotella sp.]